jgi:hypothetical protein
MDGGGVIVSVHQPQYLAWLGYFDKIASSDLFVVLDLPQYKKREFQNRNRIKSANGEVWLTVPVISKGKADQPIKDVLIDNSQEWCKSHWQTLELAYKKSAHWERYGGELKAFYEKPWQSLCELNTAQVLLFIKFLGITTPVKIESEIGTAGVSTERILELCAKTGGSAYLSGSGGKDYMEEGRFAQQGLKLYYQHYKHPEYAQLWPKQPFMPYLSVLDLLMNEGERSLEILRSGGSMEEYVPVP